MKRRLFTGGGQPRVLGNLWEGSPKALDKKNRFLYNMPRISPVREVETARKIGEGRLPLAHGFSKGEVRFKDGRFLFGRRLTPGGTAFGSILGKGVRKP